MLEELTDIWVKHHDREWIAVTTNGNVKANGQAVMGAGIAKGAAMRYPDLPKKLGYAIRNQGNRLFVFPDYQIITFPTKVNFWEASSLRLIEQSCRELMDALGRLRITAGVERVYLPRPGCQNGRLNWEQQVKPVIAPLLDDRVIVVNKEA